MRFFVKRRGTVRSHDLISTGHWVAIVTATCCRILTFTMDRRVNRIGTRPSTKPRKSTALGRWRLGHLWRLYSHTAVALWALALHSTGSFEWIVDVFLALVPFADVAARNRSSCRIWVV